MLKRLAHAMGRAYIRKINRNEALSQSFHGVNERPVELAFLFRCLAELQPKTVLDVGTGTSPLPALMNNCGCIVEAVDNVDDYWKNGAFVNRHWHVRRGDIRHETEIRQHDMVTCISVLEHISTPATALQAMAVHLREGGHLVLTTPYSERHYVDNVYALPGADIRGPLAYKCRSASRKTLTNWTEAARLSIVNQEYWRFYTGDVWRHGERLDVPVQVNAEERHQLTCLLLRKSA